MSEHDPSESLQEFPFDDPKSAHPGCWYGWDTQATEIATAYTYVMVLPSGSLVRTDVVQDDVDRISSTCVFVPGPIIDEQSSPRPSGSKWDKYRTRKR